MRALFVMVLLAIASAAAARPVVFHVSEPVGPGETALLFGDGIGPMVKAVGWRVPDNAVAAPPVNAALADAGAQPLEVLQASDLCAKVLLPADWKPGLYAVKLTNADGTSDPIFLNRTKPTWWLGGEGQTAFTGETVRVFGNNFGEKTRAWLSANGANVELPVLKAEKYTASFTVPPTLPPGDYLLWAHNGYGGTAGFGEPLTVRVAKRDPWPSTQFNVRDFGARGNGSGERGDNEPDDTPAFEAALAKAGANGGGIVFVPRGTYKLTGKLFVPPHTILRGEKREWVYLYTPKELPEFDTVIAGNGDFAVEELSIISQTARRLIVCPDLPSVYSRTRGYVPPDKVGHNARLRRLLLQHVRYSHRSRFPIDAPFRSELEGMTTVVLGGPDMEIADCTFVSNGTTFALHGAHQCRITGNHLGTGRCGGYMTWDAEDYVFENNSVDPLDTEATGGGFQGHVYHVYFAGNTFRNMYGLDREALSFDSPYYAAWRGLAGTVEGNTLTTRDASGVAKTWIPNALKGQACFITFGKGMGQYIPVASNNETTVTLERPFVVPLDQTSQIVFVTTKTDTIVANNTFSDASVAVQLYCQCYGLIIDGNRAERTGGIYGFAGGNGWSEQKKLFHYTICCFNQFINNDLSQGFVYQQGMSMNGVLGPCIESTQNQPPAIVGMGNIIRNNTARDNQTAGSMGARAHPLALVAPLNGVGYVCRDTVIEGNTLTDTPLAVDVYPYHLDTLLRNNHIERVTRPLRDDGINTWIHPGERLGYQVKGVKLLLGEKADLTGIERAAAELAREPTSALGLVDRCAQVRAQLWAEVARCQPEGTTPDMAAVLVGLRCEIAPLLSLAYGRAGKADLIAAMRTEPWSPEVGVKFAVTPPVGWHVKDSDPITLPPFKVVNLTSSMLLPEKPEAKTLQFRYTVTLGGVPLTVIDHIDVSRRDVSNWMVIGPFPNVSPTLPDTTIHPAETRLDLAGEYAGLSGPVKWQPTVINNKYVALSKLLGTSESATALAVTCLRADKAIPVEVTATCRGALQIWLKDRLVSTFPKYGSKTFRLDLEEGDNVILCKSSVKTGPWEFTLDFKELSVDEQAHVRQVPAAELKGVTSLMPPPAKPVPANALQQSGGVKWKLVLSDDFDRRLIGNSWKVVSGEWSIQDGTLVGKDPSFIALTKKISPPVRIEYDVMSALPSDLSCFWLREPINMGSGCVFAFSSGETGSRIMIEGEPAASSETSEAKAAPNKWYHIIAQVLAKGKVQLIVDGRELLIAKNAKSGAAFPGLWTWDGSHFKNVRIYSGSDE